MSPWIKALIVAAILSMLTVAASFVYFVREKQSPKVEAKEQPSVALEQKPTPEHKEPTFDATKCGINGYKYDSTGRAIECAEETAATPAPTPEETHESVVAWRPSGNLGIVLLALHFQAIDISRYSGEQVRVQIKADSGLNFWVASRDSSQQNGFDPNSVTCLRKQVFNVSAECTIPENGVLILQDVRQAGTAFSAILSRGRNSDTIAAQNKVNITFFQQKCVEWCQ